MYIYYGVIAGTSAGIIYIATVANAVKWFPDKRGLAAGCTAAGFGGGAALTLIPISWTIKAGLADLHGHLGNCPDDHRHWRALILTHPPSGWRPLGWVPKPVTRRRKQYTWKETLERKSFTSCISCLMFCVSAA